MSYTLPVDALIEVQLIGRLHGQRTRNVHHYTYVGEDDLPDGATALLAFANEWDEEVFPGYWGISSFEQEYEYISVQMLKPTRYRAVFFIPTTPQGTIEQSSLPSVCSGVVSLYADHSGRHYQGRKYVSGIPVGEEDDSRLSVDYVNGLNNLGSLLASQVLVSGTDPYDPTLYTGRGAAPPFSQAITDWLPRNIIRVQRRREIGVGE